MSDFDRTIKKLDLAMQEKLGELTKGVSAKKLGEIHSFMKEAKGLLDTLISIEVSDDVRNNYLEGNCDSDEIDEIDETLYDFIMDGCQLIYSLYILIDDEKIKETNSEWVHDDVEEFLGVARNLFGSRVPTLPEMRLVSKPKGKRKEKKNGEKCP